MEKKILSDAANDIINAFTAVIAASGGGDYRNWTIGIGKSKNPFKSGDRCYSWQNTLASVAREVIGHFITLDMTSLISLENITDENISLVCIFIERNRNVGI